MGYSTQFNGGLLFAKELKATELAYLKTILGEDCRAHPEWEAGTNMTYMDFEFNDNFSGLRWNGAEKSYDMEEKVDLIIRLMKEKFGDFELTGFLAAQGEDASDRWTLKMENNKAVKVPIPMATDEIKCPECGAIFKI